MQKQWQALFPSASEKVEIENRVVEIDQIVDVHLDSVKDIGLYTGLSGYLLHKIILWKYFNNEKYYQDSEKLLNKIFDIIEASEFNDRSYCSGLAGVGMLIKYLMDHEVFELDGEEILNELDIPILEAINYSTHSNNFDFLYGSTGLGIYLLERKNIPKYLPQLESLVLKIEKVSVKTEAGRRLDQLEPYEPEFIGTNFGLAHGLPAIIVFLVKAFRKNILPDKTKTLAREFVDFIISNKNQNESDISVFPNFITEHEAHKDRYSRLAWCYGDLGIAMSLLQFARLFKDDKVLEFTYEVLKKAAFRQLHSEPHPTTDPFICHGAAGIAHMFNRAFHYSNIDEIKNASINWTKVVLKFLNNDAYIESIKNNHERLDVLNGIAGTSLVLLALIATKEPCWDEYFLLS